MDMSVNDDAAPLTVSVEVGGALVGLGRQGSYQAVWRGELPTISFGGRRKYVLLSRLTERVGRPITAADVGRAEEIVRARKMAGASS